LSGWAACWSEQCGQEPPQSRSGEMNTDQLLDLLKTGVIQGLLLPLSAALVAGIASGIQEKLSAGIQSRSYRSTLELHRQRIETIKDLLTEKSFAIGSLQRARFQAELNLIGAELLVLSRKQAASERSEADVLGWRRLPLWRRVFTLPRPRSIEGLMATGFFLLFLYLSGLSIAATYKWAEIRGGVELFTFLLVILSSIVLPVFVGLVLGTLPYGLAEEKISSAGERNINWSERSSFPSHQQQLSSGRR